MGGFGSAGPRTIFQIGSVTKVFTALLLADMAERGEVRLSDPAASFLPGLPGEKGSVTLADLATHTSGLPRLPRGLLWSALPHPQDPYVRYPHARFVRAARRALRVGSGDSPYAYSNFGYGLLGYLLGQATGTTYEALVATRICGPLGLPDTTFEVPGPALDRKAQGHQRGRAVPDWHLGALAAAGALYSTAADLARLLQACLAAAPPAPPSAASAPEGGTSAASAPEGGPSAASAPEGGTSAASAPEGGHLRRIRPGRRLAGARDPGHPDPATPDSRRRDQLGLAPHPTQ